MEPVIQRTAQEQRCREEDPNLTINELLGFFSCEGHATTPHQYMNQPSCFLPLVQEARKLAQKIKQEEALQWSGIPMEQLLNRTIEQLSTIELYPVTPANSTSSGSKGAPTQRHYYHIRKVR